MRKHILFVIILAYSILLGHSASADTLREASKSNSEKNVVILCYHQFHVKKLLDASASLDNAYTISIEDFRAQMDEIKREGYTVIPINDYLDYLAGKKDIPDKSVVITIDDGYLSVYKYAYPLLKSYKYPFTIYVYSDWIGATKLSMTWDVIREMDKSGIVTVGSHTRRHPYMTKPSFVHSPKYKEMIHDEVYNSKVAIEKEIGHPITTLAYPYGAYNEDVILEVIKSGYLAAVSVNSGSTNKNRNEWALNRMIVRNDTNMGMFISMLRNMPIDVDYTLLTPYDGQAVEAASVSFNARILNPDVISHPIHIYINGVDHTSELDLSKLNNGIITGSVTNYKKGYNMITIFSHDKATGCFREASWSFFSK